MTDQHGRPSSAEPSGDGGHLDELTLLLLADAEPVSAGAAAHASACAVCTARVEGLREEAMALSASFALESAELSLLAAALLPERVAAQVLASQRPWLAWVPLLWALLPFASGYAGWLLVAPSIGNLMGVARQTGVLDVALSLSADLLLRIAGAYASVVEATSSAPGFDAPLAVLGLCALALWAVLLATSRPTMAPSPVAA